MWLLISSWKSPLLIVMEVRHVSHKTLSLLDRRLCYRFGPALFPGRFFLVGLLLLLSVNQAAAGLVGLGEPPLFPQSPKSAVISEGRLAPGLAPSGPLSVNPQSRAASRNFFNQYYLASDEAINWTGNRATCNAGDTDILFRDVVQLRLNYFRAMAGVPAAVIFSDTYNAMAQKAALMMSVNGQLSHYPPASWTCYSADGAQAAGHSNLALGYCGREVIDAYMNDAGIDSLGHRRWVLYPQTQIMGTGDAPPTGGYAANALWVIDPAHFGDPRPPTREEFVAWPPPGYVPYQVVFSRWSFSYAGADFGAATVTMTQGGAGVAVSLGTPANGYGENTLAWTPLNQNWSKPPKDKTYLVTIHNVLIIGSSRSFTYKVTVFDPAVAPPALAPLMPLLD